MCGGSFWMGLGPCLGPVSCGQWLNAIPESNPSFLSRKIWAVALERGDMATQTDNRTKGAFDGGVASLGSMFTASSLESTFVAYCL